MKRPRMAVAMEKARGRYELKAQDFSNLGQVRKLVAAVCDGWASLVYCSRCKQLAAVVFRDFNASCEDGVDSWHGNADEHDTTCEQCENWDET